MSPALADGSLSTTKPGKSCYCSLDCELLKGSADGRWRKYLLSEDTDFCKIMCSNIPRCHFI